MRVQSYKQYLSLLEKRPSISLFRKGVSIIIGLALIFFGITSAFYYYQYKKEAPIRAKNEYLQQASSGFFSAKQSLSDLLIGFQVAGAKVETIDKLKESSASASGFYVTLDDIEKTIASIESTRNNFSFLKDQLSKLPAPKELGDFNTQLTTYYAGGISLCDDLIKDHKFAKEFLLASGSSFYLPKFSDETIWNLGKKEEIIAYYQKIKEDADKTLANLASLDAPADYKEDLKNQITYIGLLVKTSTDIIQTLSQKDEPDTEKATQLEKAYQILVGAKKESENISQKLLEFRLNFLKGEKNLSKFDTLKISQNSLQVLLDKAFEDQSKNKNYQFLNFLHNFKIF